MIVKYRTKDGDVLDALVFKQYPGYPQSPTTEQVLTANPGLAEHGPYLPADLIITFPEIQKIKKKSVPVTKFWN